MSRWNLAWLVGIPFVILLGLTLTYSAPPLREKDQNYELVKLVVDVLDEVDQNYVRELDPAARRKLVEDMVNGGLERLDPYSAFMNEEEFKEFEHKSDGSFGGVGIQVALDRTSGGLVVTTPLVGTPAFEAGILAGDQIVKINGKTLELARSTEAVKLIQGPVGQPVTLTVVHEGQKKPVDVTIVRGEIKIETVLGDHRKADNPGEWDYVIDKDKKIGYVRLLEFRKADGRDAGKSPDATASRRHSRLGSGPARQSRRLAHLGRRRFRPIPDQRPDCQHQGP